MWSGGSVARSSDAVADAGPLIHLNQVNRLLVLEALPTVVVTSEVLKEIGSRALLPKNSRIADSNPTTRDLTGLIASKHGLGLGEASAIALCRHERIPLLLSDDLEAREVARSYGLETHGTLGLIARAYRRRMISKSEALDTIDALRSKSSLYLTADLVVWVKARIESFRR